MKTTKTDLIKLKRISTRRQEIRRINRINYIPYKSSRYLRDLRFLPPSGRGFSHFWVVTPCIGIVYGCFMTDLSVPSPWIKQSKKNTGNSWKCVQQEADKTCRHSMCEGLSAHRKAYFCRPVLTCQTTYSSFSKILAKLVGLRATNISKFFHPVNDDLGNKYSGWVQHSL
jgi:hypothetical protein